MNNKFPQLEKFLNQIKKDEAVLISSFSNIVYMTNYSGFSKEEREAYLFVTKNNQYILTDARYSEAVKTLVSDFKLIEISLNNPVKKVLKHLVKKHRIKHVAFEGHDISFLEHKKLLMDFNDSNHRSLESLRIIKTAEEISKIEKACNIGDDAFKHILKRIKLGISEKEVAYEIEFFIKKQGADLSFRTIVAFGKNSAVPHHLTSDKRLAISDKFILLDFGIKYNNYCSDMTRTIFFGKPTTELKKMYETVKQAQQKAIDYLTTSDPLRSEASERRASSADKAARDYIISKGYKSIPHGLGHGVGIDVHEAPHLSPKSEDILKEGMVSSIEPGIYIPKVGGVRIEDLVVLEKSGPRLLTHSAKNLIEI